MKPSADDYVFVLDLLFYVSTFATVITTILLGVYLTGYLEHSKVCTIISLLIMMFLGMSFATILYTFDVRNAFKAYSTSNSLVNIQK